MRNLLKSAEELRMRNMATGTEVHTHDLSIMRSRFLYETGDFSSDVSLVPQ
jgi:hypothetical protein